MKIKNEKEGEKRRKIRGGEKNEKKKTEEGAKENTIDSPQCHKYGLAFAFCLFVVFNGISTFLGCLMPNPFF